MTQESAPKPVDVVMAVYNGERHLSAALDGVLAQTFRDFDLIVVDDGSNDRTVSMLGDYAARDARVRVIQSPRNMGLVHTRNACLAACRAPLMAIADADDLFAPERLQKQVDFLDRHPDVGFLGTNATLIDSDGHQIGRQQQLPLDDGRIRFELLLGGCFWNTSTIYRTDLVRKAGAYRAGYDGVEDYDLWSRLLSLTRAANLPERLVCQRLHASSFTAALTNVLKRQSAVSRSRLAAYLEREVSEDDALAALTLFMYGWRVPVRHADVPGGLRLLADTAARAETREAGDVSAVFRHRVARSLRQQAELQASGHRRHALGLFAHAIRWDPGVVASKDAARLLATLALPAAAVAALRQARRRSFESNPPEQTHRR